MSIKYSQASVAVAITRQYRQGKTPGSKHEIDNKNRKKCLPSRVIFVSLLSRLVTSLILTKMYCCHRCTFLRFFLSQRQGNSNRRRFINFLILLHLLLSYKIFTVLTQPLPLSVMISSKFHAIKFAHSEGQKVKSGDNFSSRGADHAPCWPFRKEISIYSCAAHNCNFPKLVFSPRNRTCFWV